ncbi:DUF664 domain-containing protein [Kitasatospora sp. NPDC056138]|uniref:mycothiol transferase n=1 Tax=Kitasatospora sp. NPDC056138 TaxID=3345724 RepID=UPI0035DFFAC4
MAETRACDAVATGHDLDETFVSSRGLPLTLRWVYVMPIQEYARHNGHADFLRERTDGATGDRVRGPDRAVPAAPAVPAVPSSRRPGPLAPP